MVREQNASADEFQSTHPRGVRLRGLTARRTAWNFNPRTHVGCDLFLFLSNFIATFISIHAPTWGATISNKLGPERGVISIHAPTWGATPTMRSGKTRNNISIHAPTWGATPRGLSSPPRRYFNPRTHVGCDLVIAYDGERQEVFQSTHPRGVRQKKSCIFVIVKDFNPRTHVGCD